VIRRVLIVGTSGSGKTTLGRALARRLDVTFVETDALCHGADWTEVSDEELAARLEDATAPAGWVVDNGYPRKVGDLVLHRADTVLWIDLPLVISQWRLFCRSVRNIVGREELWNGNRQSLRRAFWGRNCLAAWAIRTHRSLRRTIDDRVDRSPNQPTLVRLRSRRQIREWVRAQPERSGDARDHHGEPAGHALDRAVAPRPSSTTPTSRAVDGGSGDELRPVDVSPLHILKMWEQSGAEWTSIRINAAEVEIELRTCAGELVEEIRSSDLELVRYVTARPSSGSPGS
jgi:adenylate kinase family enzyme